MSPNTWVFSYHGHSKQVKLAFRRLAAIIETPSNTNEMYIYPLSKTSSLIATYRIAKKMVVDGGVSNHRVSYDLL